MIDALDPANTVSVIVPVYNGASTVRRAIQSLLDQTVPVYEIIIVDDGSSDNTADVVRQLAAAEPRIKPIILEQNAGVSNARNTALNAATGAWVCVLDADDWFDRNRIRVFLEAARTVSADVLIDNLQIYDHASGQTVNTTSYNAQPGRITALTLEDFFNQDNPLQNFAIGYSKPMIRRSFVNQHNLRYDTQYSLGEDFFFLAEIIANKGRAFALPEALYVYVHHISPTTGEVSPHSRSEAKFGQIVHGCDTMLTRYRNQMTAREVNALLRRRRLFQELIGARSLKYALKQRRLGKIIRLLSSNPSIMWFSLHVIMRKRKNSGHVTQHNIIVPAAQPMGLYKTLQADMRVLTVNGDGLLTMIGALLRRAGFLAVFLYRLAAICVQKGALGRAVASFLARLNIFLNGCDISSRAVVGPGFKLAHPVGIVIGPAVIGSNVMMLQGVTLGMRHFTDAEDDPVNYPVIGDNVILGTGAKIIGGIKIGNHALIGANAVVLEDVPACATAVGIPARIVKVKCPDIV